MTNEDHSGKREDGLLLKFVGWFVVLVTSVASPVIGLIVAYNAWNRYHPLGVSATEVLLGAAVAVALSGALGVMATYRVARWAAVPRWLPPTLTIIAAVSLVLYCEAGIRVAESFTSPG
jgi:hypothetical protein